MEELLMCSVCIERYNEFQRVPVLLPRCGHSFCRSCVSMLISGGCIICPSCRTDQRIDSADRLPTEYTLLAIIHSQEDTKKETCDKHCVKLSFWCKTCSIATCGECLFEDHPTHTHDVIRAARYISDMKQCAQEVAVKFLEALDDREQKLYKIIFTSARRISDALQNVKVLRKDMEEARELMKGVKEEESIRAATSLSEASKFLGLKWNIQDVNFDRNDGSKDLEERDEIDIAKEKARKEMKEEEENKQKEEDKSKKTTKNEEENLKEKEPKRILRKSKTLSSVEMMKETEKMTEARPIVPEKSKCEEETGDIKEIKDSKKPTEELKVEEKKSEEPKEKIDQKVDPKKSNSESHAEYKPEKVPDLATVKPKGKFTIKKPLKKLDQPSIVEEKPPSKPSESLPPIQESSPKPVDDSSQSTEDRVVVSDQAVDIPKEPVDQEEIKSNKVDENLNSELEKSKQEEYFEKEGKLSNFIQVPGFMVCVEAADGRLAEMTWGPQGLHVHSLQFSQISYDVVINSAMLKALVPSKSPVVFLELSADQTTLGRIYIKLWGHLRRASNFLSLCLGDEGKSYLNTKFLQVYNVNSSGERILGGDYEFNNGRGGCQLLENLEWNGDYSMPMKAGMITAAGSGQAATNSLYLLCTQSDHSRNFSCPFGLVCEGLKVAKDAVQQTATKQVWISDCGVLIIPHNI